MMIEMRWVTAEPKEFGIQVEDLKLKLQYRYILTGMNKVEYWSAWLDVMIPIYENQIKDKKPTEYSKIDRFYGDKYDNPPS